MDYEAKIEDKLGEIAQTVGKLEDSINKYQEADGRVASFFGQQRALHEIKSILRKSDEIEEYHRERAEYDLDNFGLHVEDEGSGFTALSPTESAQDVALDQINTQLMRLDDTLDGENDTSGKLRCYVEQKRALHQIKKILHEAGQYDGYHEDELKDLNSLYTIQ